MGDDDIMVADALCDWLSDEPEELPENEDYDEPDHEGYNNDFGDCDGWFGKRLRIKT